MTEHERVALAAKARLRDPEWRRRFLADPNDRVLLLAGRHGAGPARTDVRRGPALSGVCLGKTIDFSQTRGAVPIADRQSVHCVPVIVRALGRIKAEAARTRSGLKRATRWPWRGATVQPRRRRAHTDDRDGVTETFRSST